MTSFIITRGLDKCLFGYTLDEWQQIEEENENLTYDKKTHFYAYVLVLLK